MRGLGMRLLAVLGVLVGGLASGSGAWAVALGQVDDFEDGTTQGWTIGILGGPADPQNVADGGPDGAGDGYLLLTAIGGSGVGSRLASINQGQWAGDYTAAGVTGITLSANNLGATDLSLRLYFADASMTNTAISTQALLLPSGGGWTDLFFPVLAGDLTAVTGDAGLALSSADELRILHATLAEFPPDVVVAQLGIDDVRAVPEPGTASLVLLGLTAQALARSGTRRRRESR